MQYREFGKTGVQVSALGFGAMRLPKREVDGKSVFDHEAGASLIRYAVEKGINYVDSAPYYCDSESETIVGKALKGIRDQVYLSTKLPGEDRSEKAARDRLDASLTRLQTDWIDFYHLWGLNWERYEQQALPEGQIQAVRRAKEEGLIRHISFSVHDTPENILRLIDTGLFETMLCQYNLLNRDNEQAIGYAASQGLGVVIMGPVGGGRLGVPSPVVQALLPGKVQSSPEIALRYVLTHPGVSCALSGMENTQMVDENVAVASNASPLSPQEQQQVEKSMQENKERAKLYCTGCNYCMPCPQDVNIPLNFELMNYHRVYGLTEYARQRYAKIGTEELKGKPAGACVGCGVCEEKCPQHLKIREQLAQTAQTLG